MRTIKKFVAAAALAAAALTLAACGSNSGSGDSNSGATVLSGNAAQRSVTVLDTPFTKPNLVLTDTKGKPYNLREETDHKPTLIYFGYTHCPDVCPLTMSNLGIAKRSLPKAEQSKLQVVFITTDPERDTPAALGKWLPAAGDPSFIGLTGKFSTIQAAARQIGIGVDPPVKEKDGSIVSTHGAEVIAFSPKTNGGYLLYDDTATAKDYSKDLPKILKGENP